MMALRWIFTRYLFWVGILFFISTTTIDWPTVHYKRDRYVLGIFYNGNFKNCLDGAVYADTVKRINPQDQSYKQYMTFCKDLQSDS